MRVKFRIDIFEVEKLKKGKWVNVRHEGAVFEITAELAGVEFKDNECHTGVMVRWRSPENPEE